MTAPLPIGALFTIERDEVGTVSDLVPVKQLAATIRESAEHVLRVALAKHGYHLTATELAEVAREVANNSAMNIGVLEIG